MTVVAAYDESSVPLASLPLTFSTADTKALLGVGISGSGVGALRKHAGGMFLASDLGGYAAVVSIWIYTAVLRNGLPRQCEHWLAMTGFFDSLNMPPAYFLNAPTRKVGKRARRNQRFLHFLARYAV